MINNYTAIIQQTILRQHNTNSWSDYGCQKQLKYSTKTRYDKNSCVKNLVVVSYDWIIIARGRLLSQ